jgi:acyl CoA:acetate/3-ketoacid CoA transferase alpha subunit
MTAKKFTNFTDKDFTHSFDGVPYTFKAGETIMLEDFKADHFAKHLVDQQMNDLRMVTSNVVERTKLLARCFQDQDVPVVSLPVEDKKVKKPKKVEKEFEDLKVKKSK